MSHNANIREAEPDWYVIQAKRLVEMGKVAKNSSSLIYSCLEARIALERADLLMILMTVPSALHQDLIEASKPRRGISKLNSKIGSLKERYQLFIMAIFDAVGMTTNYYDFKKSKMLQDRLSSYLHSYYLQTAQLEFESDVIQAIPSLIDDVYEFLRVSYYQENGKYEMRCVDIISLCPEDRMLLDRWKDDRKMDYTELVEELRSNMKKRACKG